MEHSVTFRDVDWTDRAQAIEFLVEDSRLLSGSAHPFDAVQARRLAERDYDHARHFRSATNHTMLRGGEVWRCRLHEIRAPLLVIHGTEDPISPIDHGVALSEAIAGAKMVRLERSGHELHETDWEEIIAAIVKHTARQPVSKRYREPVRIPSRE